ncbi:MAG: hypothetical protein V4538_15470 [Bacteroidota bacterium]
MEQQLTTIHQMSTNDVMNMAKVFAESGMFADTKQAAQAFVKIQAGQEIGIPPFQSMSGIHIIQGKVTIGAGVIASRVKGSGKYDYKVIKQDDTICSLDFYQGKEKLGNSTFTIDDAKKALTKNIDKFPRNMLFARAVSNGVKWYCPDVFSGPVYTPEEMDFNEPNKTIETTHVDVTPIVPEIFKTLDERIKDAEQLLSDSSSIEEMTDKYKSLDKDVKKDKTIINLCAEIKMHFTSNNNENES